MKLSEPDLRAELHELVRPIAPRVDLNAVVVQGNLLRQRRWTTWVAGGVTAMLAAVDALAQTAPAGLNMSSSAQATPVGAGGPREAIDAFVRGQYVGTYLNHGANSEGWWGEGEIKFYIDGDTDFPTICGTGEEDYFCGSYGFRERKEGDQYVYDSFSSPYTGFYHVPWKGSQRRFGMYRWHITDPIRFREDLKVTIQALGWQSEGRYLPLQDDLSSVAFWYQTEPHAPYPPLPEKEKLVIDWSSK